MAYVHSTSDSESIGNEDDLNFLLVDLAFAPQRVVVPRINLMDLSDLECNQLFRWKWKDETVACLWYVSVLLQLPVYELCCFGCCIGYVVLQVCKGWHESPCQCSCLAKSICLSTRTTATGMEAQMVLLRRLVYPSRWCDLVSLFGRTEPELIMIFNTVSKHVHCTVYGNYNWS